VHTKYTLPSKINDKIVLKINHQLRWGGVGYFSNELLSRIQFTMHFIDSTVNVILTRQTYDQRSNRDAESKRLVLENNFHKRIYHMFLVSKM